MNVSRLRFSFIRHLKMTFKLVFLNTWLKNEGAIDADQFGRILVSMPKEVSCHELLI
jgi:hypothetical protein